MMCEHCDEDSICGCHNGTCRGCTCQIEGGKQNDKNK